MNKLPAEGATTRITASFMFRCWRSVIQSVACVLVLAHAPLGFSKATTQPAPCSFADSTSEDASDIQGVVHYQAAIKQLFAGQKFAELDCLADAVRASKAHFASGSWKLRVFYSAIDAPQGHATEEDWTAHLKTLSRWVSAKPKSITARVALAGAYTKYAWNARGTDYSDTVTQSGWKLFDQRIEKAKKILEEAARLEAKCPHWYSAMQTVALAQSWDLARATALLDQAVGFEPDYYYYYRNHANYLRPEWHGEVGDAEKFAAEAADRVGGAKGDVLYFRIATELICHCKAEAHLPLLSWPRIQKGTAELERQNGVSLTNLNWLAYMAVKQKDGIVARNMFARIGNDWDKEIWRTQQYFDSSMKWASERAAYEEMPGPQIFRQANEKFADVIRQCVQESGGDVTKFDLILNLQKEGVVDSALSIPQTKTGLCLAKLKGETLSPPPYLPFAFRLAVDPAQIIRASAK